MSNIKNKMTIKTIFFIIIIIYNKKFILNASEIILNNVEKKPDIKSANNKQTEMYEKKN